MPFDWMTPELPPDTAEKGKQRFLEMHVREVEERARLLRNLHHDRDYAIRRIQANIAWEFELSKLPPTYKEVTKLVDGVYGARSTK